MGRPYKKPRLFEDRISKLPDEILHQILSHLTTKFVVKTSILSRRWQYLWTSARSLHFDCREFLSTSVVNYRLIIYFRCFVDLVLALRENSHIENFTLVWHHDFNMDEANKWLSHAIRTNLSNLKTLHIRNIPPNEGLATLISNCPVLDNLSMVMAVGDIKISAPNLKEFDLCCDDSGPIACKLHIFVPMLVRLHVRCISGTIPELSFECKLENLVQACIFCDVGPHGNGRNLLGILRSLQNAKSLTLKGNAVEFLYEVSKQPLSSLCNLRSLTMEMPVDVVNIQVIIRLLQNCPKLEKLVIEIPKEINLDQQSTKTVYDLISWESSSTCSFNHLKEVEIVRFHFGDEDEVGLVYFLLKQSCSLRKMQIRYEEKFPDCEICTKIIKKLKSLALSLGTNIRFTSCTS